METIAKMELTQVERVIAPTVPANVEWLPLNTIMKYFEEEEWGDAQMMAELYKGKVLFDHSDRTWYFFRGHAWVPDRKNYVMNLVSSNVAAQYLHAIAAINQIEMGTIDDKVKELLKRAKSLKYYNRMNDILKLAKTHPDLSITGDEWHKNSLLTACPNGVIDLTDGKLRFRDGEPEDYLRHTIPTEWKGIGSKAPRFEQFLSEIFAGDTGLIDFIQRLFGYGLTGVATDDKFPILWGEGRNGKDTLLETIEYVLSNALAAPVQSEVLVTTDRNANAATPHLIALRNRRIVWVNETNEGARLNGGQVKLLTGGGTIAARPLYGQATEFKPTHLIMLMTNHKPHPGDDDAIWKRLLLVPFTERFVDEPVGQHEHPVDIDLGNKLKSEASGILAWLVMGALMWMEDGLHAPETVKSATKEYKSKENMVDMFVDEMCVVGGDKEETSTVLYECYRRWSEESGFGKGMSITSFGERLGKIVTKKRTNAGSRYIGISLKIY